VARITDFRPGETKGFKVTVSLDGVAQDIRSDVVTFRMKDSVDDTDAAAKVTKTANVTTSGLTGIAIFTLVPIDTSTLPKGKYHVDVLWEPVGGGEHVVYSDILHLLERVSDV